MLRWHSQNETQWVCKLTLMLTRQSIIVVLVIACTVFFLPYKCICLILFTKWILNAKKFPSTQLQLVFCYHSLTQLAGLTFPNHSLHSQLISWKNPFTPLIFTTPTHHSWVELPITGSYWVQFFLFYFVESA